MNRQYTSPIGPSKSTYMRVGRTVHYTHVGPTEHATGSFGFGNRTHAKNFASSSARTSGVNLTSHHYGRNIAIGAGVAGVAGGGLYLGHKWHQHNVRKNAERHLATKGAR